MCGGATSKKKMQRRKRNDLMTIRNEGAKIVIVGDKGVGKTSIMRYFVDGYVDEVSMTHFAGKESELKSVTVPGGLQIKLQLWDATVNRVTDIMPNFFRGMMGVIIVYDGTKTDVETFMQLREWIQLVDTSEYVKSSCRYVVKNKADIEVPLPSNEGKKCAENHDFQYMEVSATTGQNIDLLFTILAREIYTSR